MAVDERISKSASMENLPKIALSNVAAYLEATTRALLAVALSAPPSSWEKYDRTKATSRASKIVMTSGQDEINWEKLDFWGVDKSVRNKLTDGDVCGILVCIKAGKKLKILRLPHCISIRGDGLAPLRGSGVLEEIDLSLMGRYKESLSIDPKPMLSEDTVLPILHSILDTDGTSLKYLRLPKMWREQQSEVLGRLLNKYNHVLNNRKLECSKCDGICTGTIQRPWVTQRDGAYGVQNFTCHGCKNYICQTCESDNILQVCPSCESKHCCSYVVKTCRVCQAEGCDWCTEYYYCDKCGTYECGGCDTSEDCSPRIKCSGEFCGATNCMDCVSRGVEDVKQCTLCDRLFCSSCKQIEHCFRVGGDVCSGCHSKHHDDTFECYWQLLPTKLQQLLPNFATEISLGNLVQFWNECTQLQFFGADKEFDLYMYRKSQHAQASSLVLAVDYLLKGKDNEAVYMMFFIGFMREIEGRGPDYIARWFEKNGDQDSLTGDFLCANFEWFYYCCDHSKSRADIVAFMHEASRYTRRGELQNMLTNHEASSYQIHNIEILNRGMEVAIKQCSLQTQIAIKNLDTGKTEPWYGGRYGWAVYSDTTLGWLLKMYVIRCNFVPRLGGPQITSSTKYFRVVHKGKTLFLSSTGKKSLHKLGIQANDELIVGGVEKSEISAHGNSADTTSTNDNNRSKKPRGSTKKKKSKQPKVPTPPLLTEDQITKKNREIHSRDMSRVFEELNPLLKCIRNHLNDLIIYKSAPKARNPSSGKRSKPRATALSTEDSLSGKAGRVAYPVLVGDISNLYKTSKSSTRPPITIDLHRYSRDEALDTLDKSLLVWVETAMRGEYPWVIPVDIICGGGRQILSEAVKAWIRSNRQVANRPKNS